jgi:hypothetical protein
MENQRKNVLTTGVVKIVRCITKPESYVSTSDGD